MTHHESQLRAVLIALKAIHDDEARKWSADQTESQMLMDMQGFHRQRDGIFQLVESALTKEAT